MGGNAPPAPTSIEFGSSARTKPAQPGIRYAPIRQVAATKDPFEGAGLCAWRPYEHMFVSRAAEFKGNLFATSDHSGYRESMIDPPPTAPPDRPDPALGRVIRRLREERGLGRTQLAARSGLEEDALARIEAGTLDPSWPSVEALAGALGVSVRSLAAAVVADDTDTA